MTSTKTTWLVAILCLGMGWSTTGFARCTGAQISGIWEVAFSDGNSCRLRVVLGGTVDTEQSICYDPDRGTSALDSGNLKVDAHCFSG